MPDKRTREIERAASTGDGDALRRLTRERIRSGEIQAVLKTSTDMLPGDRFLGAYGRPLGQILCQVSEQQAGLYLAGWALAGAGGGVYVIEPEDGNLGRLRALQEAWGLRGTPAGQTPPGHLLPRQPCLGMADWFAGVARYVEVGQPVTVCHRNDRYGARVIKRSPSGHRVQVARVAKHLPRRNVRGAPQRMFSRRRISGDWVEVGGQSPYLRFAEAYDYRAREI